MIQTIKRSAILIFITGVIFSFTADAFANVKVLSAAGKVEILKKGKTSWREAERGDVLRRDDRIKTGRASNCDLSFDAKDKNIVSILENSDVIIRLRGNEKLEIIDASVYAQLSGIPHGSAFEIKAPTAVCGARGTGLGVKGNKDGTEGTAFKKDIYIKNNKGEEKKIKEGFMRKVDKSGRISDAVETKIENMQKFKAWGNRLGFIKKKTDGSQKRRENKKINNIVKSKEKNLKRGLNIREKKDDSIIDKKDKTTDSSNDSQPNGGSEIGS